MNPSPSTVTVVLATGEFNSIPLPGRPVLV
jgi:hypothetical protein